MKSVYSAVRTGSLNKAVCHPSLKGYESYTESHRPTLSSPLKALLAITK